MAVSVGAKPCFCDRKHPKVRDVHSTVALPPQCPGAHWFWKGMRSHCSACHEAKGETVLPQDRAPEAALLLAGADEGVLETWKEKQLAHQLARAEELYRAFHGNFEYLTKWKPKGQEDDPKVPAGAPLKDPRWAKVFLSEARFIHIYGDRALLEVQGATPLADPGIGTIEAVNRAGHALVCPRHGIDGVEPEEWYGIPGSELLAPEALYDSLSLRGWLTGEMRLAWLRFCEECMLPAITTMAAGLAASYKDWKRKNP